MTTAKFSPSGCYIASGDVKGKLRVWAYDNEEHLCKLDIPIFQGPIRDLSWDFESKRLVIVGEGSKSDASSVCTKVIQWDTGVTCGNLAQHTMKKAMSCSFKPSRPMRIVTGGEEDSKCLFNSGPPFKRVSDGKPDESCHTRGAVNCVRYNKQGTMIASVGTDKSVCFYDGKTMELLKRMELVHNSSIYSCAWNENGDQLLTCSADGTTKLISTADFTLVQTWDLNDAGKKGDKVPLGAMQMGCAFVQGDVPVTVSLNGNITILSMSDNADKKSLIGHQSPISCMAINYKDEVMYTGDSDGMICMWDVRTGKSINYVQRGEYSEEKFDETSMDRVHKGAITGLLVCSDEKLLSIGWDDKIRTTESSVCQGSVKLPSQPNSVVRGTHLVVVMTVDGFLLVNNNVQVSDPIKTAYEPTSVCVSKDDKLVYVGGMDCAIHVYQVQNDSEVEEIKTLSNTHLQPIHAISISNDGSKLASADVRDICVWNIYEDYNPIIRKGRWCFHNQKISTLAWSNDDSVLASGAQDDSIYLWNLKKPIKRVQYSFAHRGGITGLEFLKNMDGMVLASVGNDGCVNLWDVTDEVMKKFG